MKGHTNNPNGRPKGKPNKVTTEMRTFLKSVLEQNQRQITKDLKALEPKERLIILEKFMSYVVPKQAQQEINISSLNDDAIQKIANDVLHGVENAEETEPNDEI